MKDNAKPAISIDYKTKKRIRIHRVTLHLLNDPEWVQLLINPNTRTIAVRRGNPADPLALRVFPMNGEKDSFEIRSVSLLKSLKLLFPEWEDGNSYRLLGKMDPDGGVAYFGLNDAVKEEDDS